MGDRFVLDAERRVNGNRDMDNMMHFHGGNERLDMIVGFDGNHPQLKVNITMLKNKKTGLAELWVFDEKVWTETFPDHS